jgi:hypothetical protein
MLLQLQVYVVLFGGFMNLATFKACVLAASMFVAGMHSL